MLGESLAFRWTFGDAQLLRAAFAKRSPETSHFGTTLTETLELAALPVLSVACTVKRCAPGGRFTCVLSGLAVDAPTATPSTSSSTKAKGLFDTDMANTGSGELSVLPSEGEQMETVNALLARTGQDQVASPKNCPMSETKADEPG